MPVCGIVGCSNRQGEEEGVSFFKIPKILKNQGEDTQKLCDERRRVWKAALNRKDILTEERWDRTVVCSLHFVGGTKAYLHDQTNPAWAPTLHLASPDISVPVSTTSNIKRYQRRSQRKHKKRESEAISSLLTLKKRYVEFSAHEQTNNTDVVVDEGSCCEMVDKVVDSESDTGEESTNQREIEVQTGLTGEDIKEMEENNTARILEPAALKATADGLYDFGTYERDPDKVEFYTGLPNIGVLKFVFSFMKEPMSNDSKCLSKENEYLLCLIKLRMNYLFKDMAYQLHVSATAVKRSFYNTLDVMCAQLNFLVRSPKRENLKMSTPSCFREHFGDSLCVMLDCLELFTETRSEASNKVCTSSSDSKNHHTVKYLLGIAPQGVVTFVSKRWDGRTSDKNITEKSGILGYLLPGDVVIVDSGFKIEEGVTFYEAVRATAWPTRGNTQLQPFDLEKTNSASVHIHVERVKGLVFTVLRKFRIFESDIPFEFLKLRKSDNISTIDKIVKVCCCLTNLCFSAVPM